MRFFTAILLFVVCIGHVAAQNTASTIKGYVVEKESQQPVGFATIMVIDKHNNKNLGGGITAEDGSFIVETNATDFFITISFMGLETDTFTDFILTKGNIELGKIELHSNSEQLNNVIVRAEKSQTQFKLDKRVFNVGKDLSSTGASALEVLNNVPSVNVNIDGQVSLRGSAGVQILINGKPSVLANEQGNALGTITADMIEQIEVITNPSAKYDAEGTSGIINIIIKKEDREGINGSASLNLGTPVNHSFGLSLNRRTEKFNFFSQIGVGRRELPSYSSGINEDLQLNNTIHQEGIEYRNETFYNFILGTDYHINDNNVVTLSGSYAYEVEDQPSFTEFQLEDFTGETINTWNRSENTAATNPKLQYELQYKSKLKGHKNHSLGLSAVGNYFGKKQASEFFNTTTFGTQSFADQQTETEFEEGRYTFNIDYVKPFSDKITLETGSQYVINNVSNDFEVRNFENGNWTPDARQTNLFEYSQNVLGVYGTGAFEAKRWGVKLGLRAENTQLNTLLVNTNEVNEMNFTNLFPSFHTSYKYTTNLSFQLGYSRRIFRPRLWDLNPFFNIRNNFSIRTGNPNLLPEYTDSYELTGIYVLDKASFNMGVFQRYTTDVVERIATFNENVTTTMPYNIGTNRSTGLEFNAKYTPIEKITLTGDFNYNYFKRQGTLETTTFDFTGDQWTSKLTTKIKLPYDIDFETTGRYESSFVTVQSEVAAILFMDLGLRKKLLKGKGVVNVSVRDLFASRIRQSETFQQHFYLSSSSYRGRFITLGFSYGFGKGEAMEYSGRRR